MASPNPNHLTASGRAPYGCRVKRYVSVSLVVMLALAACSGHSGSSVRTGSPPATLRAACIGIAHDIRHDAQNAGGHAAAVRQMAADLHWDVSGLPSDDPLRQDMTTTTAISDRVATELDENVTNPLTQQLGRRLDRSLAGFKRACSESPIRAGQMIVKCGVDHDGHPTAVVAGFDHSDRPFYGHPYAGFRLSKYRPFRKIWRRVRYTRGHRPIGEVGYTARFTWRGVTTHHKVDCTFGGH